MCINCCDIDPLYSHRSVHKVFISPLITPKMLQFLSSLNYSVVLPSPLSITSCFCLYPGTLICCFYFFVGIEISIITTEAKLKVSSIKIMRFNKRSFCHLWSLYMKEKKKKLRNFMGFFWMNFKN